MQTPACATDSSRKTARPGTRTWCCTPRITASTGTAASSTYTLARVRHSNRPGLPSSFHRRHIAVTSPGCHAYLASRFPAAAGAKTTEGLQRADQGCGQDDGVQQREAI